MLDPKRKSVQKVSLSPGNQGGEKNTRRGMMKNFKRGGFLSTQKEGKNRESGGEEL